VDRPITEPGKGRLWIVDYSEGEGNKRERKRNKKPTKAAQRKAQEDAFRAEHQSAASNASAVEVGAQEDIRRSVVNDRVRTPVNVNNNIPSPSVEYSFISENRLEARPPSSTSMLTTRMSDAHIDPILREGGHIAGEGRMRPPRSSYPRRSSSMFLPPVQIRQNVRVPGRHHTSESGGSHSPSPPVTSTRVVHPQLGHSTGMGHSGRARPAAPEHRFGQGSLGGVATQYTIPGPMNWTPYGSNLQQSPHPTHADDNALLLSGVPGNTPSTSTYPTAVQGPPRPHAHPEASTSRLPVSNYRENARASGHRAGRRVYTDSRGIEYHSNGQDSYSSGSD
jgi:hypothetical protein